MIKVWNSVQLIPQRVKNIEFGLVVLLFYFCLSVGLLAIVVIIATAESRTTAQMTARGCLACSIGENCQYPLENKNPTFLALPHNWNSSRVVYLSFKQTKMETNQLTGYVWFWISLWLCNLNLKPLLLEWKSDNCWTDFMLSVWISVTKFIVKTDSV